MPRTASWHFAPGERIGRYRIVAGIARGGMAEIYLARWQVTDRLRRSVAIKRLVMEDRGRSESVDMFLGEIQIGFRLDHPGVVRVLDVVEWQGEHLIVMEYVHGCSLRRLLRGPRASLGASLHILIGVARALDHVHNLRDEAGRHLGIVHRDVSPDNIMVAVDGTAKLIDFGIARSTVRTEVTLPNVLKGKVGYLSPEQLRCDPLDGRSDIFQLGTVAYELLTGRRLFDGDSVAAIMNQVFADEIPPLQEANPSLDDELCDIVVRALAYDPEDRHPTAGALADDLARFAERHAIRWSADHVIEHLRSHVPPTDLTPNPATSPDGREGAPRDGHPNPSTVRLDAPPGSGPERWRAGNRLMPAGLLLALAGAAASGVAGWTAHHASDEATMARSLGWLPLSLALGSLGILMLLTVAFYRRRPPGEQD